MTLLQALVLEPFVPGPQVLMALAARQRPAGLGATPGTIDRLISGASFSGPWATLAMLGTAIYVVWRLTRPAKRAMWVSRQLRRNPSTLTSERVRELRELKKIIRQEIYELNDTWPRPSDFKRRLANLQTEKNTVEELLSEHFGR